MEEVIGVNVVITESVTADRSNILGNVLIGQGGAFKGISTNCFQTGAELDTGQIGTIEESACIDLSDVIRNRDFCESLTIAKGISADFRQTDGQCCKTQLITAIERIIADIGDGIGHGNLRQIIAVIERIVADAVDGAVQINSRQCVVVFERLVTDSDNVLAVDLGRYTGRAVRTVVLGDGHAVTGCGVFVNIGIRNIMILYKSVGGSILQTVNLKVGLYFGESILTDRFDLIVDNRTISVGISERIIADFGTGRSDIESRGLALRYKHQLCLISVIEVAVGVGAIITARTLDFDLPETGSTFKGAVIFCLFTGSKAEGGGVALKGDIVDIGIIERSVAHISDGRRNGNSIQFAVGKGLILNSRHG